MDDNRTRGARLRQARQAAGFVSAREAAQRMGWKESSYQQHESGVRGMKPDVVDEYAAAFNTTAAWIMYGQGEQPRRRQQPQQLHGEMAENDVAPFVGAAPDEQAMMRQIARAVAPLDHHPAYYVAHRTRADLMITKGDVLVLSLEAKASQGDTVIVQVYDEAGEASTQLRQLLGDQLVADRDTEPRSITLGASNALVRGKVVAVIRATP